MMVSPNPSRASSTELARISKLEKGVLAALEPVGTENDGGTAADAIRALELGNALVVIPRCVLLFYRHGISLLRHKLR